MGIHSTSNSINVKNASISGGKYERLNIPSSKDDQKEKIKNTKRDNTENKERTADSQKKRSVGENSGENNVVSEQQNNNKTKIRFIDGPLERKT